MFMVYRTTETVRWKQASVHPASSAVLEFTRDNLIIDSFVEISLHNFFSERDIEKKICDGALRKSLTKSYFKFIYSSDYLICILSTTLYV